MANLRYLTRPAQAIRKIFRRSARKSPTVSGAAEDAVVGSEVVEPIRPITPPSSSTTNASSPPPPSAKASPLVASPEQSDCPEIYLEALTESDTTVGNGGLPVPVSGRRLGSESTRSNASQRGRADSGGHELRELLRQERKICHPRRHDYIIPRTKLEALVTVPAVVQDLQARDPEIDDPTAHKHAEKVVDCAQKIYAILAHLKRGPDIGGLLNEGITDADLPLLMRLEGKIELRKKDGQAIKTFAAWPSNLLEDFDFYQFKVNVPVFAESEHHDFDMCTILPFIRLKEGENAEKLDGGYSTVYPVRIHPDHHEFWTSRSEDEEPLVAVKQLFSSLPEDFQKEQDILLRLGTKNHPHLIKLLATFKQDKKYHLMFPFADANLRTYWNKHHPLPEFDEPTILWSLSQMRGICQALQLIHNFSVTFHLPAPNPTELKVPKNMKLDVSKGEELYGRHGDIKPENLLWFKKDLGCTSPKGILKIADFGLGRFHGRDSRSKVDPGTVAASPTYEPPECRLRLPVSRAYDIWSLGCLFLEFITWLLKGSKEIEDFADFRGRVAPSTDIDEDNFYTVLPDSYGTEAVVRGEVLKWVDRLHEHEKCSQLIHDLLNLTMCDLLVIDSRHRITSTALTVRLGDILKKAKENKDYMLMPVPLQPKHGRSNSTPGVFREPKSNSKRTSVRFADHSIGSALPKPNLTLIGNLPKDLVLRNRGTPNYRVPKTWPQNLTT